MKRTGKKMNEDKKNINIDVEDFNTMTLIAHKKGFVYAKGHPHEGKMNSAQTFKFIIDNQRVEQP